MTDTIWLKAHDLLRLRGWTTGSEENREGCMCAGGAIAKALTGDAYNMYHDWKPNDVNAVLKKFAEHVKAPTEDDDLNLEWPSERVATWNDRLGAEGEAAVLKALMELHEIEVQNG